MAEEKKKKTLGYRRADFFGEKVGLKSLEEYLIAAHEKLTDISQRSFAAENQPVIECRKYLHDKNIGVFLHLAAYTPGEPASTVRKHKETVGGEIDTTPPPAGSEFMDGDLMVLVAENHVLLCSTNLHEKKAERYMVSIIEASKQNKNASKFGLAKIGDIDNLKLIQAHGVKSIILDASMFDATIDYGNRKTISTKISGGIMDNLLALISKDKNEFEINQVEDLQAKIVINCDGRKKNPIGKSSLQDLAEQIIDEDEEGFIIVTNGDEKIRQNQTTLSKKINLPRHGKSVFRSDAWRALEDYYYELKSGGFLEQ